MTGMRFVVRNRGRMAVVRVLSVYREICRLSLHVAVGVLIGFLLATSFRCAAVRYSIKYCPLSQGSHSSSTSTPVICGKLCEHPASAATTESPGAITTERGKFYTDRNLVLVAVMTAREFLKTRAVAVHETWAKSIPGEVIFFSSEGSEKDSPPGIKVVGLRGVDDVYPPQKKAFLMLKYIHDHYLDKFRFFIRADDDVYIKGETFLEFLHSINSTGMPVIGRTGFGNKEEFGKLYLGNDENYCMGGPGMIITREILAKTVPNIKYCLKNLYTTHEDVEIGRCFKQFANVTCTWSYQNTFYHNFDEPKGSFTQSLRTKDVQKAITLHPVKIPTYTYRLHQHVLALKSASLRNRLRRLQQEVDAMNSLLKHEDTTTDHSPHNEVPSNGTIQRTADDVLHWDFTSSHLYSSQHQNPKLRLKTDTSIGRQDVYAETLDIINTKAPSERSVYKNIPYAFSRTHPFRGQEYVIAIEAKHRKRRNSMSTKNTFLQMNARRPFTEVEFREDIRSIYDESAHRDEFVETSSNFASTNRINFLLPLAGRYSTFLNFMQNFENVCLKTNENISLTIMLFRNDPNDTSADVIAYVTRLKQTYNDSSLSVVLMNGNFSRGVALQNGSRLFEDDDLLFFVDVDVELRSSSLLRIRLNSVKCQTVYAPIFFSHFDPHNLPPNVSSNHPKDIAAQFESDLGYWRQYGFGMISTYKSDFDRSGGFKQDIKGWGLEDTNLVEKFISAKLDIMRSVEIGMSHLFHPIICDRSLKKKQYDMCIGTKVTTSSSTNKMSDIIYNTPEIFDRNDHLKKLSSATRPTISTSTTSS